MRTRALAAMAVGALYLVGARTPAATVSGVVKDMTAGGKPVGGVEVELSGVDTTIAARSFRTMAGPNGEFHFGQIPGRLGAQHQLVTTFAGQRQATPPFRVARDTSDVTLAVFDTTSSAKDIAIEKIHLIINPVDDGVGVTSVYLLRNWGPIYVGGSERTPGGRRIGLKFLLPKAATDFQILQGVIAAHHAVIPGGFASTIPFHPGTDTLVFGYKIPWSEAASGFDVESPYEIRSLSVIAMAGSVELKVEGAEQTPSPMGQQLINFERSMVPANTPVTITVKPVGGTTGRPRVGKWLIALAVVAAVGVFAFAVYARRNRRRGGGGGAVASEQQDAASGELGAADALVDEIARLDESYANDEVAEAEYVARRRELKARLMQALKDEQERLSE